LVYVPAFLTFTNSRFSQHSFLICFICSPKNTESIVADGNEIGLEVNADKTKYTGHVSKAQYKD